jgi:hypothetical protein
MLRRQLVPIVLANAVRVARARMRIGICSKTGSGKRSRIVIHLAVVETDTAVAAVIAIVVVDQESAEDAAGGADGVEVNVTNDPLIQDRLVRTSVRAVTSLERRRQHTLRLEAIPVARMLDHDATSVHARTVGQEPDADRIVMHAVTSHDQP